VYSTQTVHPAPIRAAAVRSGGSPDHDTGSGQERTSLTHEWATPGGHRAVMRYRPDTSDWNTLTSCMSPVDEYRLPRALAGWALDVGAHIGGVSVPLLLDNPDMSLVAIEGLPENVELLVANLERNGVGGRAVVINALAGDGGPGRLFYGPESHHEFIGNVDIAEHGRAADLEGVTLRGAMLRRGPAQDEPFVWAKIDCEGCEYGFLASPALASVRRIVGEVHHGIAPLRAILAATHEVTGDADLGAFEAVLR